MPVNSALSSGNGLVTAVAKANERRIRGPIDIGASLRDKVAYDASFGGRLDA